MLSCLNKLSERNPLISLAGPYSLHIYAVYAHAAYFKYIIHTHSIIYMLHSIHFFINCNNFFIIPLHFLKSTYF